MTDTTFELPFVKLFDTQGEDVYFIVTEIAAIVPHGLTPNPFATVEETAPAEPEQSDIGGIDAKIAQAASGVDTAEEARDALRGEQEGEAEDLLPTSRVVLKQGAAAQVLGSPSDIIALLFKGTQDSQGNATLEAEDVDANGYLKTLGYGA